MREKEGIKIFDLSLRNILSLSFYYYEGCTARKG